MGLLISFLLPKTLAEVALHDVGAASGTCPTAVVCGEADPILPSSWADRLEDYFPQLVGVQLLAGIGHFVPFEASDAFLESIYMVL